jgi:hypothetical protein
MKPISFKIAGRTNSSQALRNLLRQVAPVMGLGWIYLATAVAQPVPTVTFTDSWDQHLGAPVTFNGVTGYPLITYGACSVNISLPMTGVDISRFDAMTEVNLTIGGASLIANRLGDASGYARGKKSATFHYIDPADSRIKAGSLTVSWTPTGVSVTGSILYDALNGGVTYGEDAVENAGTYPISATVEASLSLGSFTLDVSGIVVTGEDMAYQSDPFLSFLLHHGSIAGTLPTPPELAVTAPTNNAKILSSPPILDLRGTASDEAGLTGIYCTVNGDTNGAPTVLADFSGVEPLTATNWSASLDLSQTPAATVGSNTISVYAVNSNQTPSLPVTLTVFWIKTAPVSVTLNPSGAGEITGITDGQTVQEGMTLPVKAVPANTNWVFLNWTDGQGNALSSTPAFGYVPPDPDSIGVPDALIANFAANPFPAIAGTYNGLFYDPDNFTPENAGYLTFKLTAQGAYTGTLKLGAGGGLALSGRFTLSPDYGDGDDSATADSWVSISKSALLDVSLSFGGLAGPARSTFTGQVSAFAAKTGLPLWPDPVNIEAALASHPTNVAPGVCNFFLSPAAIDLTQGRGACGYGSVTLAKSGSVSLMLTLADGASPVVSFAGGVSPDGRFPFYASLYGGYGVILGWMAFTNDTAQFNGAQLDIESTSVNWFANVNWLASAQNYFPNGFATDPSSFSFKAIGCRYVAPARGGNLVGSTTATLELDGDQPDKVTAPLVFNPAHNTFTVSGANTNHVSLRLAPASGAITGSFGPGKPTSFKGLWLPSLQAGFGFYLGLSNTGPVVVIGSNSPVSP